MATSRLRHSSARGGYTSHAAVALAHTVVVTAHIAAITAHIEGLRARTAIVKEQMMAIIVHKVTVIVHIVAIKFKTETVMEHKHHLDPTSAALKKSEDLFKNVEKNKKSKDNI